MPKESPTAFRLRNFTQELPPNLNIQPALTKIYELYLYQAEEESSNISEWLHKHFQRNRLAKGLSIIDKPESKQKPIDQNLFSLVIESGLDYAIIAKINEIISELATLKDLYDKVANFDSATKVYSTSSQTSFSVAPSDDYGIYSHLRKTKMTKYLERIDKTKNELRLALADLNLDSDQIELIIQSILDNNYFNLKSDKAV
ncbi:MAG: hypothetical protein OHK0017_05530 [Patescibacteria group bacterium]